MKNSLVIILILIAMTTQAQEKTIYDYKVETISGDLISLSDFEGKKVMIVNTASKCGLTPQYEQLEELYKKYKGDNFVIVGFPSNDFMEQEPGSDEEIAAFCEKNYGVTFPMMSKIKVKGDEKNPLYHYLTSKALNNHSDNEVEWNFQKYLINEEGMVEEVISPKTLPNDDKIIEWITAK